jgi:hypothetical protein
MYVEIYMLCGCDMNEALEAGKIKAAIDRRYNCPAFFSKKYNPADDKMFRNEVEKMGIECIIMKDGDEIPV